MASTLPDNDLPTKRSLSPDILTTASSATPNPPTKRRPSIRFSETTNTASKTPMSSRRPPSSDEITPIRPAASAPGRSYNTQSGDRESDNAELQDPKKSKPSSQSDNAEQSEEEVAWYKRIVEKYGSISLENKGSVARDHLALERTFLAWLRTSLAFASIGIAITQLFRLNTTIASRSEESSLPLSPLVGQSLPVELLPYLQQAFASAATAVPTLGPTLMDQLLLLPPPGSPVSSIPPHYHNAAFDEHAAARLRHVGKPLGATFLGISIIILFIGFHRYFESQHWIIRGKFPASRGSIFVVGFIAGALIIASLVVVLVIAPTTFEKKK